MIFFTSSVLMIAARPSGLRRTKITDSVQFSVSRLRFKKISLLVSSKSDIAVSDIALDFVLTLIASTDTLLFNGGHLCQ